MDRGNCQIRTPLEHAPMAQEQFYAILQGHLQDRVLHDPREQAETLAHMRAMEREGYKSALRRTEYVEKQQRKNRHYEYFAREGKEILQITDGCKTVLSEVVLFNAQIEKVERYHRQRMNGFQWRAKLHVGVEKIITPLYDEETFFSRTKLRKTIFSKFIPMLEQRMEDMAWTWLMQELAKRLDDAQIEEIPSRAGWFVNDGCCRLWTAEYEDALLLNRQIRQFHVAQTQDLKVDKVFQDLLEKIRRIGTMDFGGVFLIFFLLSFLARLGTDAPIRMGLTLIGDEADVFAQNLCCPMESGVTWMNLDGDRISIIRKNVKEIQDTPPVFVSSMPDEKSTKNRICEVMGWMQSGLIEGEKVNGPFVFCFRRFAKQYPLDATIVLDMSQLTLPKEKVFVPFENLIRLRIEDAGLYWVEELRRIVRKRLDIGGDEEFLYLVQAIEDFILRMFASEECGEQRHAELKEVLEMGRREIERQLQCKLGILLEVFQTGLMRKAEEGIVALWDRRKVPQKKMGDRTIYFDSDFYYLTQEVLRFVCSRMKIDEKSILSLKQQLVEMRVVKTYRNQRGQGRDLGVDFLVYDEKGRHIGLSGIAIMRDFWDEIGGIALWERGV